MATSDSEDFESADEWEEETKLHSEEKLSKSGSVKPEIDKDVKEGDKPRSHGHGDSDMLVDTLSKEIDKNVTVSENKPSVCVKQDLSQPGGISSEVQKSVETTEVCGDSLSAVPVVESDGWECDLEELDDDLLDEDLKEDIVEKNPVENVVCAEQKSNNKGTSKENVGSKGFESNENSDHIDNNSKDNFDAVFNKLSSSVEKEQQSSSGSGSWGGWGGWGVTSLLSTATESVSTLTTQVSHGLSSVLETGLGVPDPEELVKREVEQEKKLQETESNEQNIEEHPEDMRDEETAGIFGFGRVMSGVSSITKLVETAGNKVVTGGLGTLETIGKKTMEVLQEGDPGLRKKRALFSEKIVLSQVLREAKEKAEQEHLEMKDKEEARKVHFETLFDDYHGLVHLEALEMLSKQCNVKLQSILINMPNSKLQELQKDINNIKELCQLPEDDEPEEFDTESLRAKLTVLGKGLGVPIGNEKLLKTWDETQQWLQDCGAKQKEADAEGSSALSAREVHQKAIASLARQTAESVELFHKTAELLLVYENRNPEVETSILLEVTSTLSSQVSTTATSFSECLNGCSESTTDPEMVKCHITNVFLEAANSSSYIQEAFQLLVPVLQVAVAS